MGFRLTSRKGLVAAFVLSPVLGGGYYAADPKNLLLASQAEAHVEAFPSSSHAPERFVPGPMRVPPAARHLFTSSVKGPRADSYQAVVQTSTIAKQPVRVASLSGDVGDITGAIPRVRLQRDTVNRTGKAALVVPPLNRMAGLEQHRFDTSPSAALFLASYISPQAYSFASPSNKKAELGAGSGQPDGPTKLPRGLTFKGETEAEYQARQRRCLATAIYFEARGEPVRGQLAVAQVVMNRVRSSIYADTICGVVFQGQWQRKGCQFSFACDGHADVPRDKERWLLANRLAKQVTDGEVWLPEIGHASHYHANYVKPKWRRQMDHVKQVGRHIFYRVRYPQIKDVLTSEENQAQGLALKPNG